MKLPDVVSYGEHIDPDQIAAEAPVPSIPEEPIIPEPPETPEPIVDPDLAAISGYEIGDVVGEVPLPAWAPDPGEEFTADRLPEWVAVSVEGKVVGYSHNDPAFTTMTADEMIAAGNPDTAIYDAEQQIIGRFVNGVPELFEGAT